MLNLKPVALGNGYINPWPCFTLEVCSIFNSTAFI